VEALLAEDAGAENFLEQPALQALAAVAKVFREDGGQSLTGRKLGSFEILSLIGKGGMGEVYSARDTKLGRDVALKVLPADFARDPERLARFRREARLLASLNHPNIATIYGTEESDGLHCLIMELVPGDTLAGAGPLPLEKVLTIGRQLAEGLEEAHRKNITHRDIKPANIKVTPEGVAKILDFGLAKALVWEHPGTDLSEWPIAGDATQQGQILGTPAYMSPEQVRGKPADKQTDIWGFGCILYELLTGRAAFAGETISDTVAAVLEREPDWKPLPANIPARISELMRWCLIKDPRKRLQAIGDARIAIEDVQSRVGTDGEVALMAARRRSKVWVGIGAALFLTTILLLAALSVVHFSRPTAPEVPEIRVEANTPSTADPLSFAISPDGRRLVFSASNEGKSQLWVRPLDSLTAQPLSGTDEAFFPFWSPDSRSIGFFAEGKLKRIDIAGGAPQVLAPARGGHGGAWNRGGTILFAPTIGGPLFKVHATGDEPVAVTQLETGQSSHRFPQFLPDGRHFVYFVPGGPSQGVYTASLDGGPSKRLASADAAAVVSPSGFLLFPRQTTLFAQAFDFKTQELSGNPAPVAERVALDAVTFSPGFSATSASVAYRTGSVPVTRQLTWLDRSGKRVGNIGVSGLADFSEVELSPDAKRVAVWRAVNGNVDVWLIDAARGVPTRFTFDAQPDLRPVWSPDGSRIAFQAGRKGVSNIYWKLSSGAGAEELLVESDQQKAPNDWSSDGRFLLFRSIDPQTGFDLWVLPFAGDKKKFPFLKTAFDERNGRFSPDGKWIAYQSNESGRFEIYVQPFPGPGGKFQISTNGGGQPRWNKNGKEIFFVSLDSKMMAAPVKLLPNGRSQETGTPAALFPVRIFGGAVSGNNKQQYDVSSDGQRFLVNLVADEEVTSPITLILNWKPPTK
jgi:serine/threonine protein kinase